MQGIRRRIVHVTFYEIFAIALSSVVMLGTTPADLKLATVASILGSVYAVVWNVTYNSLFEAWEARQSVRGRSLSRRICHAFGFELGFLVVLVPAFAWMLGISLIEAFILESGMILMFLVYTFAYNLAFDRIFGLPASAR